MKKILILLFLINIGGVGLAQDIDKNGAYTNLEEALKNPDVVYALDLSNSDLNTIPDSIALFINLEELILDSNNIEVIPNFIYCFNHY